LIEMETLKGFPNLPATLRRRQSRLAPHAIEDRAPANCRASVVVNGAALASMLLVTE
jgi:hypothetical protein